MKTLLALLLSACAAHAEFIDLGTPGAYDLAIYPLHTSYLLQGQTVSLDLPFSNSVTVLRGRYARYFGVLLGLATDANGFVGFVTGTGYLLDASGNPLSTPRRLGSSSDFVGDLFAGLYPFLDSPLCTFYGAHFDLTLPDAGDHFIQYGVVALYSPFDPGFRIGPHVPDSGSPLALLAVALSGIVALRAVCNVPCRGPRGYRGYRGYRGSKIPFSLSGI